MLIEYHGPHDRVEFDMPDGSLVIVDQFHTTDVPDDVAAGLLQQPSNWRRPQVRAERGPTKKGK